MNKTWIREAFAGLLEDNSGIGLRLQLPGTVGQKAAFMMYVTMILMV